MATKTVKRVSLASQVERGLRQAQKEATTLLRTVRKRVDAAIPDAPRKTIARLETRAGKMRKELERARVRVVKDAEARVRRVLGEVEHRAAKLIRPVVTRLDVATKSDVDRLRKRISDLELRVHKAVSGPTSHSSAA